MRSLLVLTLFAVAVPDRPDPSPKTKAPPIQQMILGDWQLVNSVIGGNSDGRTGSQDAILRFTPTEIQITEKGKRLERDDAG